MEITSNNKKRLSSYLVGIAYSILVFAVSINLLSYFHITNEDAFIGYQYMEHLADGHGLVSNPGGPTEEGYSDLSRVLMISQLHKVTGVDVLYLSKIIGIISVLAILGLIYLFCSLFFSLIEIKHKNFYKHLTSIAAMTAVGFSPYVTIWATQGLETMFYSAVVTLIALLTAYSLVNKKYNYFYLIAFLSFFSLNTRPEGLMNFILFFATTLIWMAINRDFTKKPIKKLLSSALFFLILVGALAVWKLTYFGDIVSNPTYIKLSLKVWLPLFDYALGYFNSKGILFTLSMICSMAGTAFLLIRALKNQKDTKLAIYLGTLAAFIASQIFFAVYSHGDYMWYYRFFTTHYALIVLFILIAPFTLAFALHAKQPKVAILVSLIVLVVANSNESIADTTWKETSYIPPYKATMSTVQYQIADKINQKLQKDETFATSEYGIIPYFAQADGIDMAGLNNKIVAHTFKQYDIQTATIAVRDYVLSQSPNIIVTWGHYLDENDQVVFDPGVAWFFKHYYDSDFFLNYYEVNTPEEKTEWGMHFWNDKYKPTSSITLKEPEHHHKLMHGFKVEEDKIWVQPLARVLLEPAVGQNEIVIKGYIHDISAFPEQKNTIEIRYNDQAIGDAILDTTTITESGRFQIRTKFDYQIFPLEEPALITISSDQFIPSNPEDQRTLSFVMESIIME